MAAIFVLFILFMICLAILSSAFWIWMIIDCINNKFLTDTTKAVWVLVIVFTHFIGALCYLLAGRKPTYAGYPPPQGQPFQQSGVVYPQRSASIPNAPYRQTHAGNVQPGASPSYPPGVPPSFNAYQQGYQPPRVQGAVPAQESWRREDEPLATYPELPRQELPQQTNND